MSVDYLLREDGGKFIREDGGNILRESSAPPDPLPRGGGGMIVGYPRFEEPWSSEQPESRPKRSADLDRLLGVKRD